MSSLKTKFPSGFKAIALSLGMLSLVGCEELKSETAVQPLRPLDVSRSSVTISNSSSAEVALAQTVTVRMADKRGAGINGIQPVITLVDGGGVVGTEITVGTCSVSDYSGLSTCKASSNIPGTYYVKVTAPKVFQSALPVTFVQKLYALEFSQQPTCATCAVNTAFNASVRVIDRAGKPITTGAAAASPITIALTSPGAATLAGTLSGPASAGIAAFSGLSMNKIGTYTITASSGGTCGTSGAACGTSAAFTVKSGLAAKIKFVTQPAAITPSNVSMSPAPSVGLFDANDNPVTATNCTINLTRLASSPAGTLLGTTSKVSVNGVSDFALNQIRINTTVGGASYRLHATASGATGCLALAAADSDAFEITLSGVPYQLSISIPPSVSALSQIFPAQPQVQVLDIDGNLVSNDSSTVVTISKNASSPGGALVGPSSVQVVTGVATFANLYINSTSVADEGTYIYDFAGTSPGITLVSTSASHLVTADGQRAPFHLEFIDQPQPAARGQVLPAVKVRKLDSNGYLNFTDNSTVVTVALNGGGTLNGTLSRTMANGVASFDNLTVTGSTGVKTLTATTSDPYTVTSSNFAISDFGAAAQLRFVGPLINGSNSTGTNAWNPAPVVYVVDSANNTVVNDSSTSVAIRIYQRSGGSDVLMGATTKTVANGIADFSGLGIRSQDLNLTNVVLEATSPSNPNLLPGQSATFNGNKAAPASLRFSAQPVTGIKTTTAGVCWISSTTGPTVTAVTVSILDADGNVITADNTSAVSITCSNCAESGTTTVTVSNGVATFSGLQSADSRSGSILTATGPASLTKASNAFNIPACTP